MWINVFFFFFFKQKTAYEIYQCDWSSDVCSSDLMLLHVRRFENDRQQSLAVGMLQQRENPVCCVVVDRKSVV